VVSYFGWTALSSIVVLIIFVIPEVIFSWGLQVSLKNYMISNDQRFS
jgi:hypothetical protein